LAHPLAVQVMTQHCGLSRGIAEPPRDEVRRAVEECVTAECWVETGANALVSSGVPPDSFHENVILAPLP